MAERLAGGNIAIALLANTLATGTMPAALILTFASISGAHFNPTVTLMDAWQGGTPWRLAPAYVLAQCVGGIRQFTSGPAELSSSASLSQPSAC